MATSSDNSLFKNHKIWRSIASGAIGIPFGWFLFKVISTAIGVFWPEYLEALRIVFQERKYHALTTPMLLTNLCLFVLVGTAVGYVSTVLAKSRMPALVVAALVFSYAVIDHYVLLWVKLPYWYNLVVPFVLAGFIFFGSRLRTTAE